MQPYNLPLSQLDNFQNGQMLLVDKPIGWTSFDVVNKIRSHLKKIYKTGNIKVGHAGTLDPLASGLLIVCTGKYTGKIDEIQIQEKEYEGIFTLGATTPSYDTETKVESYFKTESIQDSDIHDLTQTFTGQIQQVPPVYSAIKVNGVRAYKMARNNEWVNLKPKSVCISEFKILNIVMPDVYFKVSCSKGTYIRSLAHDFGKALNNGAYLKMLCRTRIGNYHLTDALPLNKLLN